MRILVLRSVSYRTIDHDSWLENNIFMTGMQGLGGAVQGGSPEKLS